MSRRCGFCDVASPDFHQEEVYGALGLSLCFIRNEVSGSGFVNIKSTLDRDESFLLFLNSVVYNLCYMNSFVKRNGSDLFGRIGFSVQIFPIFAADQISTPSLTI